MMFNLLLLASAVAASVSGSGSDNATEWKPKGLPHHLRNLTHEPRTEIAPLACGQSSYLSNYEEVTLESPGFPERYPNNAACSWELTVPAGEEIHMWCELLHIRRGDSLEFVGVYAPFYGSFWSGVGDVIEASERETTVKINFQSNRRGRGYGFSCQFMAVPTESTGSTTESTGTTDDTNTGCTTVEGQSCVFPFNFRGSTINSCTTIDGDATPWCSTKTDANGDHVQGNWGYCSSSCQGGATTTTPAPTTTILATTPVTVGPASITTASPGTTTTTPPASQCQCGKKGGAANGRIVGGQAAEQHEYPWQVALVRANGRSPYCGGTLISTQHVLTAAHCTDGQSASAIKVLLGEHVTSDNSFTRVDVAELIQDPNYNSRSTNSDYAILRLAQPVTISTAVSPACLPAATTTTYTGSTSTVTGWGTLSSGGNQPTVLQEVDVTITSQQTCRAAYGTSAITDLMVCAMDAGKDSCQGDSGGPLIVAENGRQALVGVVSWGSGCALPNVPGVYARVTARLPWILANTAGTFSSTCKALN